MIIDQCYHQAQGLNRANRFQPIQVVAITGGKGGIGKTNISVNLSVALAKRNKRVLLMDGDLGLANIDVLLGLTVKHNLSHVICGERRLQDIMITGPQGVQIIPAASGIQHMTELDAQEISSLIHAFNELEDHTDILIVDTAAGISDDVVRLTQASQEVIIVVCNEPTALTDAYAFIKVMHKEYHINRFQVITNMVKDYEESQQLFYKLNKAAERFLDIHLNFLGCIPYDEYLRKAVKMQKAVVDLYPNAISARSFEQISTTLAQLPIKTDGSGNISFFLERLLETAQLQGSTL